jgi:mono/diheme cytochrome c family protein
MSIKLRFAIPLAALSMIAGAALSNAQEGAALYKSKCAACHGAGGEGKPAMKAPALKGTSLDAQKITDHLMKGEVTSKPPHNKGIKGLKETQAKAIADHVKSL